MYHTIVLVLRRCPLQGWNRNCNGAEIVTFCHEPILLWAELSSYHCSRQLYGMNVIESSMPVMTSFINRICDGIVFYSFSLA